MTYQSPPNILRLVEVNATEDARDRMAQEYTDWWARQEGLTFETPLEAMMSPDATREQRQWIIAYVRRWANRAEDIQL